MGDLFGGAPDIPAPAAPPAPDVKPPQGLEDVMATRRRRLSLRGTREKFVIPTGLSVGGTTVNQPSGDGLRIPTQ